MINTTPLGHWLGDLAEPLWGKQGQQILVQNPRVPVYLLQKPNTNVLGLAVGGRLLSSGEKNEKAYPCLGVLPAIYPEWLGSRDFCETHRVRFPYIAGAMARGIASVDMVVAMANAGMLGFFGSAGLPLQQVESAIQSIKQQLTQGQSWGCNLIHTPEQPETEAALVARFIEQGVHRISASAFMGLSPSIVAYAYKGVYRDTQGKVHRTNHVFAKISRPETAVVFLKPAPKKLLDQLVHEGLLSKVEGELALSLPVAEDITVEADSGGHTDSQTLTALFPSISQLANQITLEYGYARPIRVGAAGGLGTPTAIAAAFSLGAAYVLTGSINQSCVEAGTSQSVKNILAQLQIGDVTMAPSADMFEAGVKVQVLKRRSLYAARSNRLYELYKRYDSLESIPGDIIQQLEQQIFHQTIDSIWQSTQAYFEQSKPEELEKALNDPKKKMALVFRWYLGQSSRWPIEGDEDRTADFQVWCGPAMAAFNDWVKGSFLESLENRQVVQLARNLLEGSLHVTRAQQVRSVGIPITGESFVYQPKYLD